MKSMFLPSDQINPLSLLLISTDVYSNPFNYLTLCLNIPFDVETSSSRGKISSKCSLVVSVLLYVPTGTICGQLCHI